MLQAFTVFALLHHAPAAVHKITEHYRSTNPRLLFMRCGCSALRTRWNSIFFQKVQYTLVSGNKRRNNKSVQKKKKAEHEEEAEGMGQNGRKRRRSEFLYVGERSWICEKGGVIAQCFNMMTPGRQRPLSAL